MRYLVFLQCVHMFPYSLLINTQSKGLLTICIDIYFSTAHVNGREPCKYTPLSPKWRDPMQNSYSLQDAHGFTTASESEGRGGDGGEEGGRVKLGGPHTEVSSCHHDYCVTLRKLLTCVHPSVLFSNMRVRFMFTVCCESQMGSTHVKGPRLILAHSRYSIKSS